MSDAVSSRAVSTTLPARRATTGRQPATVTFQVWWGAPSAPTTSTRTGRVGACAAVSTTMPAPRSCTMAPIARTASEILNDRRWLARIHTMRARPAGRAVSPPPIIGCPKARACVPRTWVTVPVALPVMSPWSSRTATAPPASYRVGVSAGGVAALPPPACNGTSPKGARDSPSRVRAPSVMPPTASGVMAGTSAPYGVSTRPRSAVARADRDAHDPLCAAASGAAVMGTPTPGTSPAGVRLGRSSTASIDAMGVTPATVSRPNSQPYAYAPMSRSLM